MTDKPDEIVNPETIVTLKIRHADREWAKDEQRRLAKAGGPEPTHADLFQRMREIYEAEVGHASVAGEPPKLTKRDIAILRRLAELRASDDEWEKEKLGLIERMLRPRNT